MICLKIGFPSPEPNGRDWFFFFIVEVDCSSSIKVNETIENYIAIPAPIPPNIFLFNKTQNVRI